jgi:hypothetical protein
MATITIADEIFARVMAFKPLVESVLEVSLEQDAYIELLMRMSPDYLMNEFFGGADAKTLLILLEQLGAQSPEVYGLIAQVLEQNEDKAIESEKRTEVKQHLGFPEPDRKD